MEQPNESLDDLIKLLVDAKLYKKNNNKNIDQMR